MHRTQLLADLQTLLRRLEADLLERSEAMIPVKEVLRGEHQRARTAERTAQSYEAWRSDYITQLAAAWVLSGVFVRFLEDNRLIDPPRVAGPGERLSRARDEHKSRQRFSTAGRMPMTKGASLRSRVPQKWHARF